jgi:hypothetical protein
MSDPNLSGRENEVTTRVGKLKALDVIQKLNTKYPKIEWQEDSDVEEANEMFKNKDLLGLDKIRHDANSELAAQIHWKVPGGSHYINLEDAREEDYTRYKCILEGFYSGSAYTQQKGENKFSFELYLIDRLESTCQGLRKLSAQRTKCQHFSALRDNLAGLLARK